MGLVPNSTCSLMTGISPPPPSDPRGEGGGGRQNTKTYIFKYVYKSIAVS